jgi:multidrug efflux pump subunit AcrB
MFGLVLAIGIVVDDAIVVVEAVQHHLEHGKEPVEGDAVGDERSLRPGRGHWSRLVCRVCARGLHGRCHGPALQTIRPDHRHRGGFLGHQRPDAQPRIVRLDAQETEARQRPDCEVFQRLQQILRLAEHQLRQHRRQPGPQGHVLHAAVGGGGGGVWLLGKFVPGGFIPDEDKGYLFVSVQLPEGASLQRSDEILKQVEAIVRNTEGVRSAVGLAGYNILNSLNFPNSAMMFIGLKPWEERKTPALHANALVQEWNRSLPPSPARELLRLGRRRCRVTATSPASPCNCRTVPAVRSSNWPATSSSSGRGRQAPGDCPRQHHLQSATPQVKVELDREKARTLGVPVDSIFQTLQTYLSGLYVNDFVRFGRVYKVFLQAEPNFTSQPADIGKFYVAITMAAWCPSARSSRSPR